jgi:hypothetical protein
MEQRTDLIPPPKDPRGYTSPELSEICGSMVTTYDVDYTEGAWRLYTNRPFRSLIFTKEEALAIIVRHAERMLQSADVGPTYGSANGEQPPQ